MDRSYIDKKIEEYKKLIEQGDKTKADKKFSEIVGVLDYLICMDKIEPVDKVDYLDKMSEIANNSVFSDMDRMKKYNKDVMESLRQSIGLEKDDTFADNDIMNMNKLKVFEKYCQWNGLVGCWYNYLLEAIESIYDVKLDE